MQTRITKTNSMKNIQSANVFWTKHCAVVVVLLLLFGSFIIVYRERISRKVDQVNAKKLNLNDLIAGLDKADVGEGELRKVDNIMKTKKASPKLFALRKCGCTKVIIAGDDTESDKAAPKYEHTTCGEEAFARGRDQKIFAFSFFGDPNRATARKYFEGVGLNAKAIGELFPGWIVRVYHNVSEKDSGKLCELACENSNLDFCDVRRNPMAGNMNSVLPTVWRFMPLADDQVSIANFRDLDSLVGRRELSAVTAWVNSKHPLHLMRDHASHDMPILAGMWGAKVAALKKTWRRILLEMLRDRMSKPPFALAVS